MRGSYNPPISQEQKEQFLDLVASGYTRPEAADALGCSARQFRAICNPLSDHHDENFARIYKHITDKNGEHERALAERLQDEAVNRGLRSSDRLLEKLLAIYHPAWEIHRPQALRMDIKVDEIKMLFANMSDETLGQVIHELQAQPQLEAGRADAA